MEEKKREEKMYMSNGNNSSGATERAIKDLEKKLSINESEGSKTSFFPFMSFFFRSMRFLV